MGNKYNIEKQLEKTYSSCKSTLKLTSLDDRDTNINNYICNSDLEVYDFDKIKEVAYNKQNGIKSPDSVYVRDKNIFIIEFKNQNPCNIDSQDLKEKFDTSIDFFKNKVNVPNDYNFKFCLVYRAQSQNKITQRYKQGLQKQKCCSLDDYNKNNYNNFYNDIITNDVNFYKNNFKELKCS